MKRIKRAVYREQLSTLRVIDEVIELEKTKSYLRQSRSLFAYMTEELKYSEGAAMRRIHAARVVAKYPEVRELLRTRKVSLCTVSTIATELLRTGDTSLIESISGKSKREAERALISEGKKAPFREQVREIKPLALKVAPPSTATTATTGKTDNPPPPPKPEPVYRISFTATKETFQRMEEVKAGMAHTLGGSSEVVAVLFERGLKLLEKELKQKRSRKNSDSIPTSDTRYIPTELKRAVFERDECMCQYQLSGGGKCGSTHKLEIDHIKPYSLGGGTEIENLRVVCRNHNQLLAKEAGL